MNDITDIAAICTTRADNGAGACACMASAIVHPRFVRPASVSTAG
ncbi:hypothetical protein [Xanthomonas hortorum]|nr:hypothetical protein [Xanthomonas hortorum]